MSEHDLERLALADAIEEGGDPETAAAVRAAGVPVEMFSACCGNVWPRHCGQCMAGQATARLCRCGRGLADVSITVGWHDRTDRGPKERSRLGEWVCERCLDEAREEGRLL